MVQGDSLSPLIFNLCFNTFIQFIKQEKYNQFGFSPHYENDCLFHPVHWFQFPLTADNILYIIELTVGFETNLNNNAHRKELKYRPLLSDLATDYKEIKFVNLCISCLGIFGTSSNSLLKMCNDSGIDTHHLNFIISKLSTIVILTTYYIFCMRNKPWCDPELLPIKCFFQS